MELNEWHQAAVPIAEIRERLFETVALINGSRALVLEAPREAAADSDDRDGDSAVRLLGRAIRMLEMLAAQVEPMPAPHTPRRPRGRGKRG